MDKDEDLRQARCAEREIYFPLARSLLLASRSLLFPNRTAWHQHTGYQAQYCLTLTYSSPCIKDESNLSRIISPNVKSSAVGLFFFHTRERTKANFEVPRRRDSKRQCGNVMCYMRPAILIIHPAAWLPCRNGRSCLIT